MKAKFQWIIDLLFWTLLFWLTYQLILKVTGHSPTDAQVIYTALGIIITYLLGLSFKMGLFMGKVEEFMNTTKNSFRKMGTEMHILHEEIKQTTTEISTLRDGFSGLRKEFSQMREDFKLFHMKKVISHKD